MAITDKKKGVWGLDQTYNKINQGSIWDYAGLSELWVWGQMQYGSMGQNQASPGNDRSSPVQIPGTTWSNVDSQAYGRGFLATRTDGTLWSWGRNDHGQLGQNEQGSSNTSRSSPTQIGSGTDWSTEVSHARESFAIKTDGTLWTWGDNGEGSLGHNNRTKYSSPVQVGSDTTWSKCMAGSWGGAIKTDGTLWQWGYNASGALGQNNKTNYSSPVQVGSDTTWSSMSVGGSNDFVFGVKTDGTAWAWGTNGAGQLGINTNTMRSSPTQIPGTWSMIKAGTNFAYGIKTNGTLWGWGNNGNGQLGQNSISPGEISSPVQIPGTTWSDIDSGYNGFVATKTDGTLWCCGVNQFGECGQNNNDASTPRYSSPVQVGSRTGWTAPFYGFGTAGGRIYL